MKDNHTECIWNNSSNMFLIFARYDLDGSRMDWEFYL